jgi:recombination protein RecT
VEKLTLSSFDSVKQPMLSLGFTKEKFEKEARFALQIWNDPKNKYLAGATIESLLKSLVNIAQTGLTLNPIAKEAFLIPRYSSYIEKVECRLEPSYIGLMKLITDTGAVASIQTNLVYENDTYEVTLGSEMQIVHKPVLKNRGEIIAVYSVAYLPGGGKQFEQMTIEEVNDVRDISESYQAWVKDNNKHTSWNDWYGEMIRKTCLKRITKYLPRSNGKTEKLDTAIDLTNQDFMPSSQQYFLAQRLIDSSILIEPTKELLEKELLTCNVFQLNKMIEHLNEHQPNPVTDLGTGNLADINKQLDLKLAE